MNTIIYISIPKSYVIGFSPLGNGRYAKNIETGLTLQDDFVQQKLF